MSKFSKPARQESDDQLFERSNRGLRKLQKQSRAELREKARKEYWAELKAREANA